MVLALVRLTALDVALTIVVAVTLQASEPYLDPIYKRIGFESLMDRESYIQMLATVAGMGGVLIALYYAAITAVGGTIYAHVPNNIRDLLARERVGYVYMRLLAFATYLSIALLALKALGFAPLKAGVLLTCLSAGVAIIAFVRLGARAFYLFDPTMLSGDLFEQLRHGYLRMTAGTYRWLDASFQAHARNSSRNALDTFETLAEITSSKSHLNGQPLLTLCRQITGFLMQYEVEKRRIPTDSDWFPKRYSHPDWYQSSDDETSLAYHGSSGLTPKQIGEPRWIEKALIPTFYTCVQKNFEQQRYDIVLSCLQVFNSYLKSLAHQHEVEYALRLAEDLTASCLDNLFAGNSIPADQKIEQLAIVDTIAASVVELLLGYVTAIDENFTKSISTSIDRIDWRSKAAIYRAGLPAHALPQLEWLQPRLEFEIRSEGRQISPSWYIRELALLPVAEHLVDSVNALVGRANSLYQKWLEAAASKKLPWLEATIISRANEYWGKADAHIWRWEENWKALNSDKKLKLLRWPQFDFATVRKQLEENQKRTIERMAPTATELLFIQRPDTHPDFAGQFMHTVAETLLSAICKNDADSVTRLFPNLFVSSLLQFDKLRPATVAIQSDAEYAIKIASAPVLDLMDLSGYAILLAELHRNPSLSQPAIDSWTNYLDAKTSTDREQSIPKLLAACLAISESAFELPHRSLIRTTWNRSVSAELSKLEPKIVNASIRGALHGGRTVVAHESPLVRVLAAETYGSFFDGIDIFIEEYLRKREDAGSVEFSHRRRQLADALSREMDRAGEHDFDG